jgi:3-demethoxyubiquinol 3-hydroxylase
MKPHYSFLDRCCLSLDQALRTLRDQVRATKPYPAKDMADDTLNEKMRQHAAGLMRVNHTGEVCAQALYHGQGIVSRNPRLQEKMQAAAEEEGDHLAWCKQRLTELNSHSSYLNPLWYAGSFCIGLSAGMIGDAWSLGFVVETERQVIRHLEKHLQSLPKNDKRSQRILEQMESDEAAHRDEALQLGARELPRPIKTLMNYVSKIMVKTAYRI